jgi:hypothetical protein
MQLMQQDEFSDVQLPWATRQQIDEVMQDHTSVLQMDKPSPEAQILAVAHDPEIILQIPFDVVSQSARVSAVLRNPDLVLKMDRPGYKVWEMAIQKKPNLINDAPVDEQIRFFTSYHKSIPTKKQSSYEYQVTSDFLENVKNPSDELLVALLMDGWQFITHEPILTIDQIQNPSETVQMAAIKIDPANIVHIQHPTADVQWQAACMNPLIVYGENGDKIPEEKITDAMRAAAVIYGNDMQLIGVDVPGVLDRYQPGLGDFYVLCKNIGYSGDELRDRMLEHVEKLKHPEPQFNEVVDDFKTIDFGDEFDAGATITKSGGMTEEKFEESLRRMDEVLGGSSASHGRSV